MAQLERIESAVVRIQRSIDELRYVAEQIRQTMATNVEAELIHNDIRRTVDGYAHVNALLQKNGELLKRFLTSIPR